MTIFEVAAEEIREILSNALDSRAFARVVYIARRIEEIACAEGRADEIAIKTKALESFEGRAPKTHAALRDDMFGGSPSLRAKQLQLEKDSAAVRDVAQGLRDYREDLSQASRALSSGEPAPRLLGAGSPSQQTEGEESEEGGYRPPVPKEPEALKKAFAFRHNAEGPGLPRSYEEEFENELEAEKKGVDRF